jgi:sortase A
VVVETAATVYVYEVTSREIVRPWEVDVIAPVPDSPGAEPAEAVITLTSCHPRYSATERFVVHGRLVESVPREQWVPSVLRAVPATPKEG